MDKTYNCQKETEMHLVGDPFYNKASEEEGMINMIASKNPRDGTD